MLTPSIKLGEFKGVDFKISIGWVVIFILLTISFQNPESYDRYLELINLLTLGQVTLNPAFPQSQIHMLAFTVIVLLGVYASVILHEIGHATAAQNLGIDTESITLWIAGGVARIETIPVKKEFSITIAGPAVTAALIPIYALISTTLFILNTPIIAWIFLLLGLFNFLMFLFNLLPLFPLDGGRILRSQLTHKISYLKATKYATYTSFALVATAVIFMITVSYYHYLFITLTIGFISYINYKRFKKTYKNEHIIKADEFFIYEHTFKFEQETMQKEEQNTLKQYIQQQNGEITEDKNKADYIISKNPYELEEVPNTGFINPLILTHKLEENGVSLSGEFKNRFKV